jgi:hypothetical protein
VSSAETGEPQVSWMAIEPGAAVVAADGSEIGTLKQVAGDDARDIFDGLVVSHGTLEGDRYIAAERVKCIYTNRVETDLTPQEASALEPFQQSPVTEWHPDHDNSFGARLRRAWHAFTRRH